MAEQPQPWSVEKLRIVLAVLAVLAVLGQYLPSALRSFLLTLAVVDDLIAITIIVLNVNLLATVMVG